MFKYFRIKIPVKKSAASNPLLLFANKNVKKEYNVINNIPKKTKTGEICIEEILK